MISSATADFINEVDFIRKVFFSDFILNSFIVSLGFISFGGIDR